MLVVQPEMTEIERQLVAESNRGRQLLATLERRHHVPPSGPVTLEAIQHSITGGTYHPIWPVHTAIAASNKHGM